MSIEGLKNTQWNVDKKINEISAYGSLLYVSTNFGVVVVDAEKGVISQSCVLNTKVYSACEKDNQVYIATSKGVMTVSKTMNIQDRNNWTLFPVAPKYTYGTSFADTEINKIVLYKDQVHFLVPGKLICALKPDGTLEKAIDWGPTNMLVSNDNLIAFKQNIVYNFSDLYTFTYGYVSLGDLTAVTSGGNNSFWVGCNNHHLSKVQLIAGDNNATVLKSDLYVNGPLSNTPFSMQYSNNKLLVVGGGYFWFGYNYPPQFSTYNESIWKNCDANQVRSVYSGAKDFTSVAEDPLKPGHYFISGWLDGVYEFNGVDCVKYYDTSNSTLQSISNSYKDIRVTALNYDSNNNLWMTNTLVSSNIKMMDKDGNWKQYAFQPLLSVMYPDRFFCDSYGNKWIGVSLQKAALFVWNDNKTVDNLTDDTYQYLQQFVDQDGTPFTAGIKAIKEDLEGNIWLGTKTGPYKVYNSSTIASKTIVLNKIKIPRNDGTNYVDILLENVEINDIAIDGANQKWFGTENSGVYLISADGLSTIYHFTKENSILPSNRIVSLAIDKKTGLVYIGTDRGIVSYQSSYVEGSNDYSNVYTYPNPVRPDYYGDITVKGLQFDSAVKITDLNGNIINQGTSSGGTYIWNGKDIRGVRVKTGVYLVFAATESGDQGVVTKIMVVNY